MGIGFPRRFLGESAEGLNITHLQHLKVSR